MLDFNTQVGRGLFGARLRAARKRAGFKNQQELADALFIQRATVTAWETGRNFPALDNLSSLCAVLRVDLGYLCGEYSESSESASNFCAATQLSESAYNKIIELQRREVLVEVPTELERLLLSGELSEILKMLGLFRFQCNRQAALGETPGKKAQQHISEEKMLYLFSIQQQIFAYANKIEQETAPKRRGKHGK